MKRVIAFHPEIALKFGSIETAIVYQQLCFWQEIKGDGVWFYKTIQEMEEETTVKVKKQKVCLDQLTKHGFIEQKIEKVGKSPKRHFRVLIKMELSYQKALLSDLDETDISKSDKTLDLDETTKTTITEITTETTPPPQEETQFSFMDYLETMKQDKNVGIRIIAAYFENQQMTFPSKPAVQDEIKRQIKAATKIANYKYPKQKILDAFDAISNDPFYAKKGWDLNQLLTKLKHLIK